MCVVVVGAQDGEALHKAGCWCEGVCSVPGVVSPVCIENKCLLSSPTARPAVRPHRRGIWEGDDY